MTLRIGIDIDGVLADFRTAFHAAAVRCLRHDVDDGQDLETVTPLSAADVRRVWDYIAKTPNWWMDVPAYEPDQIARLYSLMRAGGWEVFFMTKRPSSAGDSVQFQTQWWIERFGFYLPAVLTVPGSRGDVANGLRLDLLVDDLALNCVDVVGGSATKALLVLRDHDPVADKHATERGIGVVRTLEEAIDMVARLHEVMPHRRGRLLRLADWFKRPAEHDRLPDNPREARPLPKD